jgi:signal peptidase
VIGLGIGALLGGVRLVVVQTESMAPTLRAGDALLVVPVAPERVQVGEIVVVRRTVPYGRTTVVAHRVVAVRPGPEFVTQGDANPQPDPGTVSGRALVGRVVGRLPGVGRGLLWLQRQSLALVLLLVGVGLLALSLTADRSRRCPRCGALWSDGPGGEGRSDAPHPA